MESEGKTTYDGLVVEEALEGLADSSGIAGLGRERGTGDMGRHHVVGHLAPRVRLGRGLREPHVSGISGELAGLQGLGDGSCVAELAAGGVDDVRSTLHGLEEGLVDHVLRLGVERAVLFGNG